MDDRQQDLAEQALDAPEQSTVNRRAVVVGGAALAGAALARLAGADSASAGHNTSIMYDSQTVVHVDVTNSTAGSTRIASNIASSAAFVALNNYQVGIARPDGMLGRTAFATGNCAGVAGASEAASGGLGVLGTADAADGTGVYGSVGSSVPSEVAPGGTGVFGRGPSRGVLGRSTGGAGVQGESTSANGVEGTTTTGAGVKGEATTGVGVLGTAGASGLAGRFVGHTVVEGALDAGTLNVAGQSTLAGLTVTGPMSLPGPVALGAATTVDKLSLPRTSGVVTLKRGAASVSVPNLPVAAGSLVVATLQRHRKGLFVVAAVPAVARKRITIHFNKKAPRGTKVAWMLIN